MKKLIAWSIAAVAVSFALAAGTRPVSATPAQPETQAGTTCPRGTTACPNCNGVGYYCSRECKDCADGAN